MKKNKGQALIAVLITAVLGLTLGVFALERVFSGSEILKESLEGENLRSLNEGVLENGLLRILRDPNYTGENLTVQEASCIIEVVSGNPKTVRAICSRGDKTKKIQTTVSFNNGLVTFTPAHEFF